jgi:DNA anti-recombination protein RmuC
MRHDGFADDGLFDRMRKFFLPLTTVEQDLKVSSTQWAAITTRRTAEKNRLERERLNVVHDLEVVEDQYYNFDELITNTARNMDGARDDNQQEATFEGQINEYRQERDRLEPRRSGLRSRLSQIDDMLENIDKALDEQIQNSDGRDLIKPNRGFIMYGPPGK